MNRQKAGRRENIVLAWKATYIKGISCSRLHEIFITFFYFYLQQPLTKNPARLLTINNATSPLFIFVFGVSTSKKKVTMASTLSLPSGQPAPNREKKSILSEMDCRYPFPSLLA